MNGSAWQTSRGLVCMTGEVRLGRFMAAVPRAKGRGFANFRFIDTNIIRKSRKNGRVGGELDGFAAG